MRVVLLRARGTGKAALDEVRAHPERQRYASAAATGLSEPMIAWARRIVKRGSPRLIAAVETGEIALYMAARVAKWGHAKQDRFLQVDEERGADGTLSPESVEPFLPRSEQRA